MSKKNKTTCPEKIYGHLEDAIIAATDAEDYAGVEEILAWFDKCGHYVKECKETLTGGAKWNLQT